MVLRNDNFKKESARTFKKFSNVHMQRKIILISVMAGDANLLPARYGDQHPRKSSLVFVLDLQHSPRGCKTMK